MFIISAERGNVMEYWYWEKIIQDKKYDVYGQEINHQEFKKYFVVDLRKMSKESLDGLFEHFLDFQRELLATEFFKEDKKVLFLYFLCDDVLKKDERTFEIRENTAYALKKFIEEEELQILLKHITGQVSVNKETKIELQTQEIILKNFNLLYGGNGSGKTLLLKEIAKELEAPIYSMHNKNLNLSPSMDEYAIYLQLILRNSSLSLYCKQLLKIIQYARIHNIPILMDDLGWNGLDSLNKVRVLDALAEASNEILTVVTASQSSIESLVRKRVYEPNIIKL